MQEMLQFILIYFFYQRKSKYSLELISLISWRKVSKGHIFCTIVCESVFQVEKTQIKFPKLLKKNPGIYLSSSLLFPLHSSENLILPRDFQAYIWLSSSEITLYLKILASISSSITKSFPNRIFIGI